MRLLAITLLLLPVFLPRSSTIIVLPQANLQAAVNSAQLGDTLVLTSGGIYNLPFGLTLPVKSGCNGSSFVTIKSSTDTPVPTIQAFRPQFNHSQLAKLITTSGNGDSAIDLAPGAGCYQLQGLELTNNTSSQVQVMVALNGGAHIVLDRVFIHPKEMADTPPFNTTGRFAIQANSQDVKVINSDIAGFYGLPPGGTAGNTAVDGNGIVIDGGPCNPCLIDNNFIESWFDPIFLGGSDPPATNPATVTASTLTSANLSHVQGLGIGMMIALEVPWSAGYCNGNVNTRPCWGNGKVLSINGNSVTYTPLIGNAPGGGPRTLLPAGSNPKIPGQAIWQGSTVSAVTITHNHIHLPTAFSAWQRANNGNNPKSFMEIKFVNGATIDGNSFDGFPSTPLGIAGYNQNGGGVWTGVFNLRFSNNWVRGFTTAFYLPLADPYYLNTNGHDITITNNMLEEPDIDGQKTGVISRITSGHNGDKISITHNTILLGYPSNYIGQAFSAEDAGQPFSYYGIGPKVIFRDNLIAAGNYGFTCFAATSAISSCWPGLIEDHNLFALNVSNPNTDILSQFPNSRTLSGWGAIQFTDQSNHVWSLVSNKGTASDGKDIGVDWAALMAAQGGAAPAPSPTPSALPTPTSTPSATPTATPTPVPTSTPSPTASPTATPTPVPSPTVVTPPLNQCSIGQWCYWAWPATQSARMAMLNNAVLFGCDPNSAMQTGSYVYILRVR